MNGNRKEMGSGKAVVILGSASTTARYLAYEFARAGYDLALGDFDHWENDRIAGDIQVRFGVQCHPMKFDALAFDTHTKFLEDAERELGVQPEGVVLCFGFMRDQKYAQKHFSIARRTIDTNLTGAVSILELYARSFEERGSGFIAVFSSVAGDRGRKANYIYGASKGGLSVYLSGLRNRLHGAGVQVTTVKPGFMDTKMTYGMPLPGPLVASPEQAAKAVYRAIIRKKNVAYVLSFWRYIMLIIRMIPEWQFKKMDI